MPIRMTDDPEQGSGKRNAPRRERGGGFSGGGGGGGMGPLVYLLPQLIGFLFKKPLVGLIVVGVGVGAYFLFIKGNMSLGPSSSENGALSKGCSMKQEVYDEALVYEPLADNVSSPLPESVSLLQYAPSRLNQGQQGSCVGWASSYAARTILYAKQTGKKPDDVRFSPSFLYNQIALEGCEGSYIIRAMEVMEGKGDLPLSAFPYTDQSCGNKPTNSQLSQAASYKIRGFNRLSQDDDQYEVNMLAIKQNIAQGAPVVIGMMVGGTFMQDMEGKNAWYPTDADYNKSGFGGHAMCVIGYDDYLDGGKGGFQIMNSWGNDWGKNGVAWVFYEDFDVFAVEAYGLYNMGDATQMSAEQRIKFGFMNNADQKLIPLKKEKDFVFRTASPIRLGTRFKVNFSNTRPCYTYIFGQESDNSSYVLFPYTPKHSPYCGTTGVRLFPKDKSLEPDAVGSRDAIGVIISPEPLDYNKLNQQISAARGNGIGEKMDNALATRLSRAATVSTDGSNILLNSTERDPKKVHALVIEFDKTK